ncbi:hypothetical protein D9757_003747 [Collybiopsis confluens]|uniref:DUF4470 domain-containing protein n=1 Tax=Collybiopsis confluens TaxID=2823264 RepID=A0A8H5HVA7_9AGAR|nr:hypothetical protein D9757_003747 [Collybiopsis confluens]
MQSPHLIKCVAQIGSESSMEGKPYLLKVSSSSKAHWPSHKKDCKHPYNRSDWKPAWVTQNRSPAFMGNDDSPQSHFGSQMAPVYVWGNTPATDCLQLEHNEGMAQIIHRDLNLCCFAASGDIRNMIMTVNGLPKDYQGRCKIVLNDRSSPVTTRNIVILYALLRNGPTVERAADVAVHLMYSSALRPSELSEFQHCVQTVYGDILASSKSFVFDMNLPHNSRKKSLAVRGVETLSVKQPILDLIAESLPMLRATHSMTDAQKTMHNVLLSPERTDYRDRHLFAL